MVTRSFLIRFLWCIVFPIVQLVCVPSYIMIVQAVLKLSIVKVMSVPGLEPWTFLSQVKCLTSVPTEPWVEAVETKPGFDLKVP